MSDVVSIGQKLTVLLLVICCGSGLLNVVLGLVNASQAGLFFALAQTVFTLFTGAAAWSIYRWKKGGWYLGIFVVLQWFSSLVNFRGSAGWFTLALSFPMAAMGVWLFLPAVRARFDVKKAFG